MTTMTIRCPECSHAIGVEMMGGEAPKKGLVFEVLCPHCEARLVCKIVKVGRSEFPAGDIVELEIVRLLPTEEF